MVTTSTGSRSLAGLFLTLLCAGAARAQLQVVTTVPDLADVVSWIGGEHVVARSLMAGHEDLHLVRILPSMVVKLRQADVFVQLGLDAEHAWVPPLLRTARNSRVEPGAAGFCNAALGVVALRVPDSSSRAQGPDLHPAGNPHYNLDPVRMRLAARNVAACLERVDPGHHHAFAQGLQRWEKALDDRIENWRRVLAPFAGAAFIEAHDTWIYFADTFGLRIAARLEPKPGLAPTPGHLNEVVDLARRERIGLVVGQARFLDVARFVATHSGGVAIELPICSSSTGPLCGWFAFMDHVVAQFAAHLRPGADAPRRGGRIAADRNGSRAGRP